MSAGEALGWAVFEGSLRDSNRVVPAAQSYVDDLLNACAQYVGTVPAGSNLYRSRLMPPRTPRWESPWPASAMGAPPSAVARGGRLNPEGIPYLYLARDEMTALAETRVWRGARATVATFSVVRELKVFDLVTAPPPHQALAMKIHWLGYVFSVPAHPDDQTAYVATQFMAESLKSRGYDGVEYPSALQPGGTNVALFKEDGVRCISTGLWEIESVSYAANPVHAATPPPYFRDST